MSVSRKKCFVRPLVRVNIPIINLEQLKKEQQFIQNAFKYSDSLQKQMAAISSFKDIEKQLISTLRNYKDHSYIKQQEGQIKFSNFMQRPKQQLKLRCKKEFKSSSFFVTQSMHEPNFLWQENRSRYHKQEFTSKPARHPHKLQLSLNLENQKFKHYLSSSLNNWV